MKEREATRRRAADMIDGSAWPPARLRAFRAALNLNQSSFARALMVSTTEVSNWEQKRVPSRPRWTNALTRSPETGAYSWSWAQPTKNAALWFQNPMHRVASLLRLKTCGPDVVLTAIAG